MLSAFPIVRSVVVHTVAVGIMVIGVWPPSATCTFSYPGIAEADVIQAVLESESHPGSPPCGCCLGSCNTSCCGSLCHCTPSPTPQPLPQEGQSSTKVKPKGISAIEWITVVFPPAEKSTRGCVENAPRGLFAHPSLQSLHVRLQP